MFCGDRKSILKPASPQKIVLLVKVVIFVALPRHKSCYILSEWYQDGYGFCLHILLIYVHRIICIYLTLFWYQMFLSIILFASIVVRKVNEFSCCFAVNEVIFVKCSVLLFVIQITKYHFCTTLL